MRTARCFLGVIVLLLVCSVLGVCSGSESTPKHQSPQEEAEGYYWYEGIFPEKEAAEKIFSTVSDDYPKYEFTPDVFHITTQYKPDPKHEELYGKPVTIRIIGYASGSVRDSEEDITSENEGLLVEISSTDEGMQAPGRMKRWQRALIRKAIRKSSRQRMPWKNLQTSCPLRKSQLRRRKNLKNPKHIRMRKP